MSGQGRPARALPARIGRQRAPGLRQRDPPAIAATQSVALARKFDIRQPIVTQGILIVNVTKEMLMFSMGTGGYTKRGHKPPTWIPVLLVLFLVALVTLLLAR